LRYREFTVENIAGKNKNKFYNLLVSAVDSGPFDGGCVIVAQAIQMKYGGEIVALLGPSQKGSKVVAQHAAVKIGDQLIDFDGPLPMQDFVRRFERNELSSTGGGITTVRLLNDDDLPDAPRDKELSLKLARLIQ